MLVAAPASSSLIVMTTDDSMSDDVFESPEDTAVSESGGGGGGGGGDGNKQMNMMTVPGEKTQQLKTPSPTGYRDYKPPADLLKLYEQQQDEAEQMVHKTILLGDSGVGKTSLLVQFDTGKFQTGTFSATVGIGFTNKVVIVDQSKVKLQIWDTAGQERFRSVTHAYYRDAHALLLLYDVTNKTSFDNIRAWLGEIREYAQDDVVIMLLGNKADCGSERLVRKEDGERLAREYNVAFMETSAKTGLNVELTFMAVARELKSRKSGNPDETKFNVQDYVREQSQRGSCPPCNT
ncbi:ras-related protein Rab-37 isoform X2 [Periplaneta americana]|uniref:ras-related protein Rab-37 isoform X2 n=1 Tax=Periplaneta americana TaxID=6978 RepID=UPI0037E7FDDD